MVRDREAFRERFRQYKEGKSVNEIYNLPGYNTGKTGFDAAIKKKIDYYYKLLRNKGYDVHSASGIIGNAIQESSLNPDSVNRIKMSGLFQNSPEIRKAIEDLYGDHSEMSQLRYLEDWVNAVDWVRKGKHREHTALYSGSFKKTGYKSAEEAADEFLKRYERAVVVKDGKIVRDKNGKPIYQDRDKRLNYANQVYSYLTGNPIIPEEVVELATAPQVIQPDAITQALPSYLARPQEQTIDYTDPRNTFWSAAQRLLEVNKALDAIDGTWKAPELPAWQPVEYEVPTWKSSYKDGKLPGYAKGKPDTEETSTATSSSAIPYKNYLILPSAIRNPEDINITTPDINVYGKAPWVNLVDESTVPDQGTVTHGKKGSGLDKIEAFSDKYYSHPILGAPARYRDYGSKVLNSIPLSPLGLVDSYKAVAEGRGTLADWADVAMAVATGFAAGKSLKPKAGSIDISKLNANELGKYLFEQHPELLKPVTDPILVNGTKITNEQLYKAAGTRIKEFAKEGRKASGDVLSLFLHPTAYLVNLGTDTRWGAIHSPSRNATAFNMDKITDPELALGVKAHEDWHQWLEIMNNNFGRPYPNNYAMDMEGNFALSPEYRSQNPAVPFGIEMDAEANRLKSLMANYTGQTGDLLNSLIPNIPLPVQLKYFGWGYTRDILKHHPDLSKANAFLSRHKDGKLPRFEDGKNLNRINTKPSGTHLDEIELLLMDNSDLSAADKIATVMSSHIMGLARLFGTGIRNADDYVTRRRELGGGTAQRTYLLPRGMQKRVFKDDGYVEGAPRDYGLVKSAVGNRNLPVYLTIRDATSRENLVHLGNILDGGYDTMFIDPARQLIHAGSFPSAIYVDGSTGQLFQKAWDLNDYGGNRAGTTYDANQWLANILDKVGSPTVVTTGYQPMIKSTPGMVGYTDMYLGDRLNEWGRDWRDDLLDRIIDRGLGEKGLYLGNVDGKRVPMLPGIEVVFDKSTGKTSYYKNGKLPMYGGGRIPSVMIPGEIIQNNKTAHDVVSYFPIVGTTMDATELASGDLSAAVPFMLGAVSDIFGGRSLYKAYSARKAFIDAVKQRKLFGTGPSLYQIRDMMHRANEEATKALSGAASVISDWYANTLQNNKTK